MFFGGSAYITVMEYVTIALTGDVTDFGDLSAARERLAGFSSSTRGVMSGGATNSPSSDTPMNVIDYITFGSTGNAIDFGDLTTARLSHSATGTNTRGVSIMGLAPGNSDVIDYVTIASTGDAADFGDSNQAGGYSRAGSDAHGGLQA